jgi:hypothetical protein
MASNPKKRQKKLERRSSKRKEKKHELVRQKSVGLPERLTDATRFPVLHCWIGTSIEDDGIGWVLLSREIPNGQVAVAVFLVDSYCLGVKNVHAEILNRLDYDSKYVNKMKKDMPFRTAPPAEARKLLEEAVDYAHNIGLAPHPDYSRAMLLFGDIHPSQSDAKFEFGKNGKPFFMAGPNDTPQRCKQIIAILNNTCGQSHFDYMMPVDPSELRMIEPDSPEDETHTFPDPYEEDEFIDEPEEYGDHRKYP